MELDHKVILVTGANRGIGKSIVESLLKRPVSKIYAACRNLSSLPSFDDPRVIPLMLDITNEESVRAATQQALDVNILINNAGVLTTASVLNDSIQSLMTDMTTNYFGTLRMVHHFSPIMEKNGQGAIANVISVVGLVSSPRIGAYSASKAALFSATQALRAELRLKNISVYSIFPGPIETDMTAQMEMTKTPVAVAAYNIVKGIEDDLEDIFPDPFSQQAGQLWSINPKALEREMGRT